MPIHNIKKICNLFKQGKSVLYFIKFQKRILIFSTSILRDLHTKIEYLFLAEVFKKTKYITNINSNPTQQLFKYFGLVHL